jgi:glycerol-3-phosphate dehydrogenase (NAD(P)+)
MKTDKIAIVGHGNIGQAIFYLLNKNPKNKRFLIDVYDKDAAKNKSGKNLKDCVTDANFIFLCIPSWIEEEVLTEISDYTKPKTILISLSKGINIAARKSIDQLIESDLKNPKYGLLSGPMFALEIKEGKMSYAILASKDKIVFEKVSELFAETTLKLEYSKEVHSVAIAAVLKNIYTLIFGMVDSFGEKNNTRGFLAGKAILEMLEIMKMLKLDKEVIMGTAGLGDFIATSGSEYSQNRKLGKEIFERGGASFKSEGYVSLSSMFKMLGKKSKKLPLLSLLERIVINKKDPQKEIEKFLKGI